MTSRKPADTTRSPQAARPGGRGARRVINGLLACVIVAGVAFVLLDRSAETDPGSAASHSETKSASAKRHPGVDPGTRAGPPEPTYTLTVDGVRVAHLDIERLSEWCRRNGLPEPPALAQAEPAIANALVGALRQVAQHPGAASFGQAGMICESLECHHSAAEYFRRAAAADPGAFRWPYYQACIFQVTGRNQEAIEMFAKSIPLDPGYPTTYGRVGQLYLERGSLDLAAAQFERYVELVPEDSLGYVGLARVALARHHYESALEYAQQGLQYATNDFQAHYALAKACTGLGDDERARRHFDICAKLPKGLWFALRDPLDQQLHAVTNSAHRIVGEIERLQSAQDWPRLAALVEQVLQRRPGDSSMMTNLAALYRKLKRFDEAHALLDQAERVDPRQLLIHITRAELYLGEARNEDALRKADDTLRRDSTSSRAFNVRGRALILMRRYEEAAEAMLECVRLQPDDPGNTLVLAEALLAGGRYDDAGKYYRRVLELSPGHDRARQRLAQLAQRRQDGAANQ